VSIKSVKEFEGLKRIGRIVRLTLDGMAAEVKPGVTTGELCRTGERILRDRGAESSPPKTYGFPAAVCISLNDEAIHGIPRNRMLLEGDLVKLDLAAEKDGFVADAAVTVRVGKVAEGAENLVRCAERAFRRGAKAARAGSRVYEIGRAVERQVHVDGFSVMRELCGHGVGRSIHEAPSVPNFFEKRSRTHLTEGLVITIEPIIAAGEGRGELQNDRWTIRTADRCLSAHYEHTIVVTKGDPIILTA
jgi:methionyl aminopeptidase